MLCQGFEAVLVLIGLCVYDSTWGVGQSGIGIEDGKLKKWLPKVNDNLSCIMTFLIVVSIEYRVFLVSMCECAA